MSEQPQIFLDPRVANTDTAGASTDSEKTESVNTSIIHLLHRASQCASDTFADEMKVQDLTPRQYAVLLTTAQNEGISQTGLVQKTGIDRSTLADIVRRMLKKGLIERHRNKNDARVYTIQMTELGSQALHLAAPAAERANNRLLANLPDEQHQKFIDFLERIIEGPGRSNS